MMLIRSKAVFSLTAFLIFSATQILAESHRDFLFLYVNKSDLRGELRTIAASSESPGRALMTYQVAIGKQDGDKQVQGDNRTPEGVYFAQRHIDGKSLPAKYGPLAVPLNFPNPIDRLAGKTGYGIWLHGVEDNERINEAKVTEGCVAFYNEDIKDLAQYLTPQQTLIMIDRKPYVEDLALVKELESRSRDWIRAWHERKIDEYMAHYGEDFRYQQMNVQAYRQHKEKIFKSYKQMKVDMTDLRVLTHSKYALSIMNQDFDGDGRFLSKGRKILYWQQDSNKHWKIVAEIFDEVPFRATNFDSQNLVSKKKSISSDIDAKL